MQVEYVPDFRQGIAESWPVSIDDTCARADWDWRPEFDLAAMTDDMMSSLLIRSKAQSRQAASSRAHSAAVAAM